MPYGVECKFILKCTAMKIKLTLMSAAVFSCFPQSPALSSSCLSSPVIPLPQGDRHFHVMLGSCDADRS